jgi:hypothetical protein
MLIFAVKVRTHRSRQKMTVAASGTAEKIVGIGEAHGNPAAHLQTAKPDPDAAAASGTLLVVPDRLVAGSPTWDAGLDALGLQRIPKPISVMVAAAEHPLCLG